MARQARDLDRVTWLLGAADVLRQRICHVRPLPEHGAYDLSLAAVRAQLGEARFAAAWQAGRAMALEQIVAIALDDC